MLVHGFNSHADHLQVMPCDTQVQRAMSALASIWGLSASDSTDLRCRRRDAREMRSAGTQSEPGVACHAHNSACATAQYMATEMAQRLGPMASIYLSKCNQAKIPNFFMHPTHDGIDRGGERCVRVHV